MTPNTLKWPQLQTFKIKKSLSDPKLQLELSQALIGHLCNEIFEKSLNQKLPIQPEVGQILKNCVGMFNCFDPWNLSAKFQRNRFVKSTQFGNSAAEIGVRYEKNAIFAF